MFAPETSISVSERLCHVICRDLPISCFLSNFGGLAILRKLTIETRVYRTKFGIVTFTLKPVGRYPAGGQFVPEVIINSVSQCFRFDSGCFDIRVTS